MKIDENQRKSLKIDGKSKENRRKIDGIQRNSINIDRNQQNPRKSTEINRNRRKLRENRWKINGNIGENQQKSTKIS
jgi:hypothetical protein